jgi:GNAT superfamily N-acetyltransferase
LTLDLDSFDSGRAVIAVRDQEGLGFTFCTLAQEQARIPTNWLLAFTELDNATRAGIHAPRSSDEMIERLAFLKVVPEALFIARRQNLYAGYTCLNVAESDNDTLSQSWTGVHPEFRGKGLATALKLHAAAYAKQRGYRRLVTSIRRTNSASLRANLKVGFQPTLTRWPHEL